MRTTAARRAPGRLATVATGAFAVGAVVALAGLAPGCKPTLNDTVSIVSKPVILAVQSTPAESPPDVSVAYTALVVDATGELHTAPVLWDYCNVRNPLSNLGPVAVECTEAGNAGLQKLGTGLSASGKIPTLACTNFGPNPPAATMNQPAGRPVDPDTSGGYYQPVTLFLGEGGEVQTLLYDMRLTCGFSGAGEQAQADLQARYHPNENPAIVSLMAGSTSLMPDGAGGGSGGGAPGDGGAGGSTNVVAAGTKLQLHVAWPPCPTTDVCGDGICGADESLTSCANDCKTPKGCAGAERYVNFDLQTEAVIDQREGIQVSWYATGGSFDSDSTGRSATDTNVTSDNGWQAPSQAGTVHLWVVLHDARGGLGWQGYALDVK